MPGGQKAPSEQVRKGGLSPLGRSQGWRQEPGAASTPRSPHTRPVNPHTTGGSRTLVPVSPARACRELEPGGSGGARGLDRFMLRLRLLLWPHAKGALSSSSLGAGRLFSQGPETRPPGSLTVPSPVQGHSCLRIHARTLVPHPRLWPVPSSPAYVTLPGSPLGTSPPKGRGCLWVSS